MRTLNKALCLVLVVVMVLGLCAFSVAAADKFPDQDKVTEKYDEAVTILHELGVMIGDTDGTFGAKGTFTRAQAATMMVRMLNAEDIAVTSTIFVDVPTTHWANKYVAYCYANDIIKGTSDTTFSPDDTLSGTQWALMLLRALGYKESGSYELYAAKTAKSAGLMKGIDSLKTVYDNRNGNPFTREEAAQIAFNTLTADMVTYGNSGIVITTPDGTTVDTSAHLEPGALDNVAFDYMTAGAAANQANAVGGAIVRDQAMQFCEEYFPRLRFDTNEDADDYGRPAKGLWYLEADGSNTVTSYSSRLDTAIISEPETAFVTYTETTKAADIAKDLKGYTINGVAINNTSNAGIGGSNGLLAIDGNLGQDLANNAGTTVAADLAAITGNGVSVEFFVTESTKTVDRVVVVNEWFGRVTAVTPAKGDAKRTITINNARGVKTFETEEFAKGDYVLYKETYDTTNARQVIDTVKLATSITGTLTKITNGTAADAVYVVGGANKGAHASSDGAGTITTLAASINKAISGKLDKDISLYVDSYGFAVGEVPSTTSAEATKYVYVIHNGASTPESANFMTGAAAINVFEIYGILPDGSVVTQKAQSASTMTQNDALFIDRVYSYTVDSKTGYWELTGADTTTGSNANDTFKNKDTTISGGGSYASVVLNSDTKFVFFTVDGTSGAVKTKTVRNGNADLGTATYTASATAVMHVAQESGVAKAVFIKGGTYASSEKAGYAYVDRTTRKSVTSTDGNSFSYDAVKSDGTEITVTSTTDLTNVGAAVYEINDDNTITNTTAVTGQTGIVEKIDGNTATIGSTPLTVTKDTLFTNVATNGQDSELMVGQTVTYTLVNGSTTEIQDIFSTVDQVKIALTLSGAVAGSTYEADTTELITGAGVVNTVKITFTKDSGDYSAADYTLSVSGDANLAAVAVVDNNGASSGQETLDNAASTITFTVTITAPTADGTLTISSMS